MKNRLDYRLLLVLITALVLIPSISSFADTTRYEYNDSSRMMKVQTGGGTAIITASAGPGGSISPAGTIGVRYTDSQTFTITPDPHYHIIAVKVDNVPVGAVSSYTFSNIGGNHTIHAEFAKDTYQLNVTLNDNSGGAVTSSPSGITCGSTCSKAYDYGAVVTLTATPQPGYDFLGWTGACGGTGTCSFIMDSSKTATANFAKKIYTVTASVDDDSKGGISPYGNVTVDYGGSQAFTITPKSGYSIMDMKVNSASIGTPSSYTFTNVTANRTISASFSCPNLPVRINRTTPLYFGTLQNAYNAAVDGELIQTHGIRLTGDLTANRNISVTVEGGYYCDYATRSGDTTVKGMVQTLPGGGTLTLKNMILGYTAPVAASTAATPPGGMYGAAQTITLTCSGSCDKIYYTTDGSTPTLASADYTAPIVISSNTILKFFATDTAGRRETVKRAFYTFDTTASTGSMIISRTAPEATKSTRVTLSLTCNESGGCAYVMFGMVGHKGTDVGIFKAGGDWSLDLDGNNVLEACDIDGCFKMGLVAGDIPVTGDWNGDGKTEIGVFRSGGYWYLDYDGNGKWDPGIDPLYRMGTVAGDKPVTGDWNGDGKTEIGIFRTGGYWYLDTNGNGTWESGVDPVYTFGLSTDIPVTGDWNGDGKTEIGTFRNGMWYLDNGNGVWNAGIDSVYAFGLSTDVPVTGDWNGDGKTKIGTFRNGTWYLDSGNGVWNPTYETDTSFAFGTTGDIPVTGNWVRNVKDTLNWTAPQAFASTKTWMLTAGDGEKTVYVKFGDAAGNWSAAFSDSILLETVAPTTTASLPEGLYTTTIEVALKCSDYNGSGCSKIHYTTDGTQPTTSSTVYTGAISLSATATLKYFAVDIAGNQEKVQSRAYAIDSAVPTGAISINNGAIGTNIREVTLTLTCVDAAGCSQMQFSNDKSVWTKPEAFTATKSWTLTAGDEVKTVYARFKDASGNWSPIYSDIIILETGAPTTTADPVGGIVSAPLSVILTCNDGTSGAGCDRIFYTTDGSTPTTVSAVFTGPIYIADTTTLKYFAIDYAGNQEAVKSQSYSFAFIRLTGSTQQYFQSLQAAYDAAANGDTIQVQATSFVENLNVNRNITVTLDGGYSNDFTTKTGMTILKGQLQTFSGTLTMKNFIIDK